MDRRRLPIKKFFTIALVFCLLMASTSALSQEIRINDRFNEKPLEELLQELEKEHPIKFFYKPGSLEGVEVSSLVINQPLEDLLLDVLSENAMTLYILDNTKYIIYPDANVKSRFRKPTQIQDRNVKILGDSTNIKFLKPAQITGQIIDANTGKGVYGASLSVENNSAKAMSRENGQFEIALMPGFYRLKAELIGMSPEIVSVMVYGPDELEITLYDQVLQLDELTISAESIQEKLTGINIGKQTITQEMLTASPPSFLGEKNIFQSLASLPGVSKGSDGAAGIIVRGQSPGQNMILLDGMPIYNTNHLFGFFSGINGDFIDQASLYKGFIPSEFGGRTSSVMEIKTVEPSMEKMKLTGLIGTSNTAIVGEVPLIKSKTSLAFSARKSYVNWVLEAWKNNSVRDNRAGYYDANLKVNHRFNDDSKLSVYGYLSDDEFSFSGDTTIGWSNRAVGSSYSLPLQNNWLAQALISDVQYDFSSDSEGAFGSESSYRVNTKTGEIKLYYDKDPIGFSTGIGLTYTNLLPGEFQPNDVAAESNRLQYEKMALAFFWEQFEWKPISKLTISIGSRNTFFTRIGDFNQLLYEDDNPQSGVISDTTTYNDGQLFLEKFRIEPRVSLNYVLTANTSIKASFNINNQYEHLISNTNNITPYDVWKQTNIYLEPQNSVQVSTGVFSSLGTENYEGSVEVFYKQLNNTIDFINGSSLFLNPKIETALVQGTGRVMGLETFVKKSAGQLTGWLSYTYSRSFRTSPGVNQNQEYPANFDIPHNVSLTGSYKASRRWTIGLNWTYLTGRPVTVPTERIAFDRFYLFNYDQRNNYRLPSYHRLDASVSYENKLKKGKKWHSSWVFSLFNVYGRDNFYSLYTVGGAGGILQAYRVSLLDQMFPSLSLRFKYE